MKINEFSIKKKIFLNRWLWAVLYAILIFALTSNPGFSYPKFGFNLIDKFYHYLVYAGLSYLLFLAFFKTGNLYLKRKAYFFSICFGTTHALASEIYQSFVPGRYCDFFDFLADFIGVVSIQLFLFLHQRPKRESL